MMAKSIVHRLAEDSILLMDGAMGTELFRRGIQTTLPSWSARAFTENPQLIYEVHQDYIRAGAEIITTNTFRTTTRSLAKVGMSDRAREWTTLAVDLARKARSDSAQKPVWIAGSVAPLEDCYDPSLVPDSETSFREHSESIRWLVDAGVDLILIETMNSIQEATAAARAASALAIPMFVSWTCTADGKILDGESLCEGIKSIEEYKPLAFLINCIPANQITAGLQKMRAVSKVPIGAYANIGVPEPNFGWKIRDDITPQAYTRFAKDWVESGIKIVGGCCGTTPDHISALSDALTF